MKLILTFFLFVFLIPVALAQTELVEGNTTFEVPNIILTPIPCPGCTQPPEDYTQTSQTIILYGDLAYLNVKWNARYSDNVERPMGIDCYLNCPNPDGDIDTNCAIYKTSTNYCSFVGNTGPRFCTIVRPDYLFKQINNITCKFYNPARLDIRYLPYPNRTFKPIDFQVFTERITGTVGKYLTLPVNIRSTGLIIETYTVNVSVANPDQAGLVYIEYPVNITSRLKYAETGKVYPKVTFLSTEKVNLKISAKSNTDPTTCSIDSDCSYLGDGECIGNRCWKKNIIETSAQKASLPEFGLFGFLQIVFLAVVVFLIRR